MIKGLSYYSVMCSTWTTYSRCGRYSLAEQRRVRAASLGRLEQRRQHLLLRLALGAARPPTDTQQAMPHAAHSTLRYHYTRWRFKQRSPTGLRDTRSVLFVRKLTKTIASYAKIKLSTTNNSKVLSMSMRRGRKISDEALLKN